MAEFREVDKVLLRLVARHRSYREMACTLAVSLATIQYRVRRLKRTGYIIGRTTRKARSLTLTQKAQYALRRRRLLKSDPAVHH